MTREQRDYQLGMYEMPAGELAMATVHIEAAQANPAVAGEHLGKALGDIASAKKLTAALTAYPYRREDT